MNYYGVCIHTIGRIICITEVPAPSANADIELNCVAGNAKLMYLNSKISSFHGILLFHKRPETHIVVLHLLQLTRHYYR